MQQRDWSGDRQPARGDRVDLGKGIMKADQYPTMKRVMELMREGLRINIANESRASGNRSALLPAHEVEASPNCLASPEFDATCDSDPGEEAQEQQLRLFGACHQLPWHCCSVILLIVIVR